MNVLGLGFLESAIVCSKGLSFTHYILFVDLASYLALVCCCICLSVDTYFLCQSIYDNTYVQQSSLS